MSTQVSPLQNLLESDEMQVFVESNQNLINEVNDSAVNFVDVIHEFVHNNPEVFVDKTVEDIAKNIRVFSEVAMAQFMTEAVSIGQEKIQYVEPLTPENALNDYV